MSKVYVKEMHSQNEYLAIGGQAVIEGVLMRSKDTVAIAVRNEKGKIILKKEEIPAWTTKYAFLGWPFLRGSIAFFQMLILGMKALTYSANVAMSEEEENLGFWEITSLITISMLFAIGFYLHPNYYRNLRPIAIGRLDF